ncbi:MAG: PqqD family protein [Bacteroidales bacterium]|nr:PqqD family protein [Bacteroidales bacterium]
MKLKKNIAISESGFVFDPTSGESFSLNPIAIEILNMLKDGKGQGDIIGFVLKKYDVDRDTLENNYFDFVGMLKQFNLLENIK